MPIMKKQLKSYAPKDLVVLRAKPAGRSDGDGQEQVQNVTSIEKNMFSNTSVKGDIKSTIPEVKKLAKELTKVSLFTTPDTLLSSAPKDICDREKFLLVAKKYVPTSTYTPTTRRKEPKFVPYEPYKACVKPILYPGSSKLKIKELTCTEKTFTTAQETDQRESDKVHTIITDFETERSHWESENRILTEENNEIKILLQDMKKEVTGLNQQLAAQSQVNNELKKLLVASVGEDFQGRVLCLTEDKARMATMIRKYSEKVDRDFEEKERMSIQCDVFRSKFLASSLLLDDLVQWKGTLIQRLDEAKESIRVLLKERDVMYPLLLNVYKHIHQVQESFDPLHADSVGTSILDSCDTVSLCIVNSLMAENVRDRLLGTLGRAVGCTDLKLPEETSSPGEKIALQVLEHCSELTKQIRSFPLTAEKSAMIQRFHPNARFDHLTVNCCGHCNGEIHLI